MSSIMTKLFSPCHTFTTTWIVPLFFAFERIDFKMTCILLLILAAFHTRCYWEKRKQKFIEFLFSLKSFVFFRCEIFFSIFWDGFMCVCNVRIVRNEMVFFFPLFCACTLIGILSRNRRVWTHQIFEDLERETNFSIEFSVSFSTSN